MRRRPKRFLARVEQASTWIRGRNVEVHGPQACTGVTAGLDENGFLRVETADGLVTVQTGGLARRGKRLACQNRKTRSSKTTMLLALDVGNTNTTLGLYRLDGEKPELAAHWRVTTHRTQTVDEYGVFFVNLFEMHGMAPSQVTDIIIASVVPPVDSTLRQVCETYFHVEPMFVEPGIKTGMTMLIDNPTELGADRIADCIAAFERYGGPCIVVDFGTAPSLK